MAAKRLSIRNGTVTGFADEVSLNGLIVVEKSIQRVSTIEPSSWWGNVAFKILRALFSDSSSVASWTRTWRTDWNVHIDGQAYGPFKDRAAAIAFEKETIYQQGKLREVE